MYEIREGKTEKGGVNGNPTRPRPSEPPQAMAVHSGEFVILNDDLIKKLIFEALGEASMCWSEIPGGTFDSKEARRIGDKLFEDIKRWA